MTQPPPPSRPRWPGLRPLRMACPWRLAGRLAGCLARVPPMLLRACVFGAVLLAAGLSSPGAHSQPASAAAVPGNAGRPAVPSGRAEGAAEIELRRGWFLAAADAAPPAGNDARWREVPLPHTGPGAVAWYRIEFERTAAASSGWVLYLPFWYGGGEVWLNGQIVASVPQSDGRTGVRWERPWLFPLPETALQPGRNVLHLRAAEAFLPTGGAGIARLTVGEAALVQPHFERRLFISRTLPMVTVAAGLAASLIVLFIWLRRRDEVQLGLFGLATLFWAIRTLTFIFDALPVEVWPWWRALYHAANGGFIVALALFAWRLARWVNRPVFIAMAVLWAIGPLTYAVLLLTGGRPEMLVGRWWVAALIPVGASIVVASARAAWIRRDTGVTVMALAMTLSFFTGVHDYLVAWRSPAFTALLPEWTAHRLFLLHHGANVMLLVLGAQLTVRFVRSLREVEEANRVLEARVAERERELAANYERIAVLQREQTRHDERHRIMQDLHDGLGSQLVTSLLRAERGALDSRATTETLRASLDEMRVAIEALTADDEDFRTAFGNFRFRWDARLRDAGLVPQWQVQLPDEPLVLPASVALQILRIAQEALTNVVKHARATKVNVVLAADASALALTVADDGVGVAPPPGDGEGDGAAARPAGGGRGLNNMRSRARQMGAQLDIGPAAATEGAPRGTRLHLVLKLAQGAAPQQARQPLAAD